MILAMSFFFPTKTFLPLIFLAFFLHLKFIPLLASAIPSIHISNMPYVHQLSHFCLCTLSLCFSCLMISSSSSKTAQFTTPECLHCSASSKSLLFIFITSQLYGFIIHYVNGNLKSVFCVCKIVHYYFPCIYLLVL